MFKGKLTYASLAVVAAPILGRLFGFEIAQAEIVELFQAAAVLTGFYGRFRATK